MKLYLSSYRLGNHSNKLQALVNQPGAKVAVCANAIDHARSDDKRQAIVQRECDDMRNLGFIPEELDLREYFNKDNIVEKMKEYKLIWINGGNVFLLVKAMKQSGFDKVFNKLIKTEKLIYAGYSAAFCALAPSLRGMELVDDKDVQVDGYQEAIIWEGFSLIDFYPVVHFRSDHPESAATEKEYEYVVSNNIPYKTFRDGDVYIVAGEKKEIL